MKRALQNRENRSEECREDGYEEKKVLKTLVQIENHEEIGQESK